MDTESFTILLSLSCTTSHPWVFLNASRADQCGTGRNQTKGFTSTHWTSRGDTPSAPTSQYLLTPTHTNTNTTHTENFSWCLCSLPPCIYTLKGMESLVVTSYSSLSLDHSHFSCYLSHAPHRPLYPCLSRIRNTHTYWRKYALEAIIKLLFISSYHDKCLLFMSRSLDSGQEHPEIPEKD